MDPIGKQKKIAGNDYHVGFQKLINEGNPRLGGGFNKSSGTRSADFRTAPYKESSWQGKTKGDTKHVKGNGNNYTD